MTDSDIVIGIRGELGQAPVIKRNLDQISSSGEKAQRSVKSLDGAFNAANRRMQLAEQRLRDLAFAGQTNTDRFKRLKDSTDRYRNSLERADNAVRKTTRSTDLAARSAGLLRTAFAGFIGLQAVSGLARFSDEVTTLETQLRNVTDSTEEFNRLNNQLFEVAQRNGVALSDLADGYLKLNLSVSDQIKDSFDLVKITEILNRGFAVSGTSARTAAETTRQLTQGLAGNFKNAAQELNSLIEGSSLFARLIAVELTGNVNASAADLKLLAEAGEITTESFLNATLAIEGAVNKFEIPPTIERSVIRLRNEFVKFASDSDSFEEAGIKVAKAIDFLADRLARARIMFQLMETPLERWIRRMREVREVTDYVSRALKDLPDEIVPPPRPGAIGSKVPAQTVVPFQNAPIPGVKPLEGYADEDALRVVEGVAKANEKLRKEEEKANDERRTGIDLTRGLSDDVRQLTRETDRFSNSVADSFGQFITGGISARQMLADIASDLAALASRRLVTDSLSSGLSAALGSITGLGSLGAGFAFGGSSTSFSASGAPIPGVKPTVVGFNNGGSFMVGGNTGVDRNVLSLNGAPVARVSRGEQVAVNPQNKSGGGITINQNINVSTGVQDTVRAEFLTLMPEIQRSTREAIKDAQARGFD